MRTGEERRRRIAFEAVCLSNGKGGRREYGIA